MLDKTPTKADIAIVKQEDTEPMTAPDIPTICGTVGLVELVSPSTSVIGLVPPPDVLVDQTAAGQLSLVIPAGPSSVTAVLSTSTEMASQQALPPAPTNIVTQVALPLVENYHIYQSEPPSLAPPTMDADSDARMLRLLEQVINHAVQPVSTSISDLQARIMNIKTTQATSLPWGADQDSILHDNFHQHFPGQLGESGDAGDDDSNMTDVLDSKRRAREEDEANHIYPFFAHVYTAIHSLPSTTYDALTPDQQTGAGFLSESWYSITTQYHLPSTIPPSNDVSTAFIEFSCIEFQAAAEQEHILCRIDHRLVDGNTSFFPNNPPLSFKAFGEPPSHLVPPERPVVERAPSIPSITSLGDCASMPIDLSSGDDTPSVPVRSTGSDPVRGTA